MSVIPAIDLLDGRLVRLAQGEFDAVTDFGDDPLAQAKSYEEQGATRLHLVNLSGAKDGVINPGFLTSLHTLAAQTDLAIQVGGGVRQLGDIFRLLDAGASAVVLSTMIFSDPEAVADAADLCGPDKIIAALDVRDGTVQTNGWQTDTDQSLTAALELVQTLGIRRVLVTDITRDGMGQGPNVDLYGQLCADYPMLTIIASGGVGNQADLDALTAIGCTQAVMGKSLLTGEAQLSDLTFNDAQCSIANSQLAVRVIPCLDVDAGRVVKGTKFADLKDAGDPVELARRYCEEGADELVFLDITATSDKRATVVDLVQRTAAAVNIPFTIGGGVRSLDDARALLQAGADKVAINSAAVRRPALLTEVSQALGAANTVCAIDARRDGDRWVVLLDGGRTATTRDALQWAIEAQQRGAGEILLTSFDRDGTGAGFDTALLQAMTEQLSIPVIASGGAGSLDDFTDACAAGASAVLAASVFHFGTYSIADVKKFLSTSFPVRL